MLLPVIKVIVPAPPVSPTTRRAVQRSPAQSRATYASRVPSGEREGLRALPSVVSGSIYGVNASATGDRWPRATHATAPTATTTPPATATLIQRGRPGTSRDSETTRENSLTDAKRSAGILLNALATAVSIPSGTVSRTTRSRVGRSVISFAMIAWTLGPVTGGSPASISYNTAPKEY